ncbi:MAG: hypothetical protein ACON49_09985 [Candidatus Puniceispirillaceae bacterium]
MLDEALWIVMIDMAVGLVQWAVIWRFIYGIFLPENSQIIGVRQLNKATDPLIKIFGFLTHRLIINRVKPLYVGFWLLLIRFYGLPTIIGYEIEGIAQLSLEAFTLSALQMMSG